MLRQQLFNDSFVHEFNQPPLFEKQGTYKPIYIFTTDLNGENAHQKTIESFGEEWKKFSDFSEEMLDTTGSEYFDIVTEDMLNQNSYVIDIGCGTGRWTKFIHERAGFIEAVDPSDAIYSADKLLRNVNNVRLSKASVDNLPFGDNTFDFGMSIGVLHHIPDTFKAMLKSVQKVKEGGYFYVYLYYSLDNRNFLFRSIFAATNLVRRVVSHLPSKPKKVICDLLAYFLYVPIVYTGKVMNKVGMKRIAKKLPLSYYQNKSMFIIRNDSLDRFGTPLEQRFSKNEIIGMMTKCGLTDIIVSENEPYYHAVGRKNTAGNSFN